MAHRGDRHTRASAGSQTLRLLAQVLLYPHRSVAPTRPHEVAVLSLEFTRKEKSSQEGGQRSENLTVVGCPGREGNLPHSVTDGDIA